jgi:hypothetical protein
VITRKFKSASVNLNYTYTWVCVSAIPDLHLPSALIQILRVCKCILRFTLAHCALFRILKKIQFLVLILKTTYNISDADSSLEILKS